MKVIFCIPPPDKRIGGLDAAIDGLRAALSQRGLEVLDESAANEDASVVHFHGLWQPAHARRGWQCAKRGLPYLVSPHGMLEPWTRRQKRWKKYPYFHLIEKHHLNRAQAVLATAPAEARRLRKNLPAQRIVTLPLGLTGNARPDYENARRALGWAPDERVLLFLSRIHVKKGLDLMLRALATHSFPEKTRLVIVGDGAPEYVRELRSFAGAHAATLPRIDWQGPIWGEARWPYFQGADLFCLPTHSENFGLAVLESCQVGTPVLTTTETPWAEILSGDCGLIGQATVGSVAQMFTTFFNRPGWREDQRRELSEWAWREYHWDALAEKYAELYARTALIRP